MLKTWSGKTTARVYIQGRVVADTKAPVQKALLIEKKLIDPANVIASAYVVKDQKNDFIGIRFGNYITQYGQSLCSAYSTIEIILFGDGVAVSGEPPRMIFTGACPRSKNESNVQSKNISSTFPLFLISDCKTNQKMNEQFQLSNGTDVKATNVDFGVSEPDWLVDKITFIDETNPVNNLEFEVQDIRSILAKSQSNRNVANSKNSDFYIPCN